MTKVLALGDLHSGHKVGLTPPSYFEPKKTKAGKLQRALWDGNERMLHEAGQCDVVLVLGDCIDGRGSRSGGTELITTDLLEQVDIATECLKYMQKVVKPKHIIMVYGTPYHVSPDGEDYEKQIAKNIGADKIGGHEWVKSGGVTFSMKHKIGGSTIPHGRFTALAKDVLWEKLWADEYEQHPRSDILLRGHVHYYGYCGSYWGTGMSLPACSGMGSKYGVRQCSGIVHYGMVVFNCDKGKYQWDALRQKAKLQMPKVLELS